MCVYEREREGGGGGWVSECANVYSSVCVCVCGIVAFQCTKTDEVKFHLISVLYYH